MDRYIVFPCETASQASASRASTIEYAHSLSCLDDASQQTTFEQHPSQFCNSESKQETRFAPSYFQVREAYSADLCCAGSIMNSGQERKHSKCLIRIFWTISLTPPLNDRFLERCCSVRNSLDKELSGKSTNQLSLASTWQSRKYRLAKQAAHACCFNK